MPEVELHVVEPAQAAGRHLLRGAQQGSPRPLFFSFGAINLMCGSCRFTLMAGMPRGASALGSVVVQCPSCSALNSGVS